MISTGFPQLDLATGIQGVPCSALTEISGPEGSGKTTLCLRLLAQATQQGLDCAWIDADHTFDPAYARRWGIDPEHVYYAGPESAETALDILERLVHSGALAAVVLDSINALTLEADLNRSLKPGEPTPTDPLISRALRNLSSGPLRRSQTALVVTNRSDPAMSAVYHGLAGNPARLALTLQAHLRLRLAPQGEGERIQVRVIKNEFTGIFETTELDLFNNNGMINVD